MKQGDIYYMKDQVDDLKRQRTILLRDLEEKELEIQKLKQCKQCVCAPCGLNGDKVCRP